MTSSRGAKRTTSMLLAMVSHVAVTGSLNAQVACPSTPLGVTSANANGEEVFFATASSVPVAVDDVALSVALAEARLAARAVLAGDRRVPIAGDARLSGVRDEGSCFDNGRVYATVSVSKNSMNKADGLNDALKKSLSRVPSPQAESYFWQDGQPFPFGDTRGK